MLFFSILLITACAYSETYNKINATKMFEYYKTKYNKQYKSEAANQRGLRNFVNNLNKVSTLNEKVVDNDTLYIVNMYADLNPEEIQERYAISLKPYTNAKDPHNSNPLRHDTGKFIEDVFLYDLTKADQLYKSFMVEFNKTIPKREQDRTAHYYRFLKTLVEINRDNFEGREQKLAGENADVVKAPNDYFS